MHSIYLRLIVITAFALTLLLTCGDGVGLVPTTSCQGAEELVAATYAGVVAYPDRFPSWAQENASVLGQKSFHRCAGLLADQLVKGALRAPSYDDIYAESMDIAGRAGVPALGPKMAEDTARSAGDLLRLASWIRQILSAIPDVIEGDLGSYHQTEPYQTAAQLWSQTANLLGTQDTQRLQNLTFELSTWFVSSYAEQLWS